MHTGLACTACVAAVVVAVAAAVTLHRHWRIRRTLRRMRVAPPGRRPSTRTYRSRSARMWEVPTVNFWATDRPNRPDRRRWYGRRNRGGTYPD